MNPLRLQHCLFCLPCLLFQRNNLICNSEIQSLSNNDVIFLVYLNFNLKQEWKNFNRGSFQSQIENKDTEQEDPYVDVTL